jgi:hypothetical protein
MRLCALAGKTEAGTGYVHVSPSEPENILRPHGRLFDHRKRQRRSAWDTPEDGEEV